MALARKEKRRFLLEPSSRVSAFEEILSGLIQGSKGSAPDEAG